jgi:hypothetical protein
MRPHLNPPSPILPRFFPTTSIIGLIEKTLCLGSYVRKSICGADDLFEDHLGGDMMTGLPQGFAELQLKIEVIGIVFAHQ